MQIRKKGGHKIDPYGAPKKTKQNKEDVIAILTLSPFLAEVLDIMHRI